MAPLRCHIFASERVCYRRQLLMTVRRFWREVGGGPPPAQPGDAPGGLRRVPRLCAPAPPALRADPDVVLCVYCNTRHTVPVAGAARGWAHPDGEPRTRARRRRRPMLTLQFPTAPTACRETGAWSAPARGRSQKRGAAPAAAAARAVAPKEDAQAPSDGASAIETRAAAEPQAAQAGVLPYYAPARTVPPSGGDAEAPVVVVVVVDGPGGGVAPRHGPLWRLRRPRGGQRALPLGTLRPPLSTTSSCCGSPPPRRPPPRHDGLSRRLGVSVPRAGGPLSNMGAGPTPDPLARPRTPTGAPSPPRQRFRPTSAP